MKKKLFECKIIKPSIVLQNINFIWNSDVLQQIKEVDLDNCWPLGLSELTLIISKLGLIHLGL